MFHSPYEAAAAFIIGHRISIVQTRRIRTAMAQELGAAIVVRGESFAAFPAPQTLVRHDMDEIYARLSKEQRILCGRQDATGRYVCDEPVAGVITRERPVGPPARQLVPLVGWALDRRKGIWHQTTSVEDRRRHGIPQIRHRVYPALPALARCPRCRAVQWLDPVRLHIARGPDS